MFVRKFEADSLEEALKEIKHELGPDAIILKTVTNKGFKGAFKKKRIEITAAVTEKDLTSKMKVDRALGDKKDQFYQNSPSFISNMISSYASNDASSVERPAKPPISPGGYGQLALNKAVKTVKPTDGRSSGQAMDLDSFLNATDSSINQTSDKSDVQNYFYEEEINHVSSPASIPQRSLQSSNTGSDQTMLSEDKIEQLGDQAKRIDELERKLFATMKMVEKLERKEPQGIYQMRVSLRSLDINETYIQKLIKKAFCELSEEDLQNGELVFEFALREMLESVKVGMPLFSQVDSDAHPVITVLLSENSSGQSSMSLKLAALKKNAVVIKNVEGIQDEKESFTEKIFGLTIIRVKNIAEIISCTRKALDEKLCVFIDYKDFHNQIMETKKFVEGLRRSFDNVEVLISLSAIHSEMYNRRVLSHYKGLASGVVVSHLDLCLNYGSLFNILEGSTSLPARFFSTGKMVPDDVEAATAERILDGIFKFD